jgi:hypothetical protein
VVLPFTLELIKDGEHADPRFETPENVARAIAEGQIPADRGLQHPVRHRAGDAVGEQASPDADFCESLSETMFKLTNW